MASAAANPPPSVLDCARVIAYAVVDPSIKYVERNTLYVGKPLKLLGPVPRLAVSQNIGEAELMVLHCDNEWNVLGVTAAHHSVEEAKTYVERSYPGIGSKWIDTNVSVEEATAFLKEHFGDLKCSFCGRMFHEVWQYFGSDNARICDICVEQFAALVKKEKEGNDAA
jgi:hypothetical protein